jgi:hypothetical protein
LTALIIVKAAVQLKDRPVDGFFVWPPPRTC